MNKLIVDLMGALLILTLTVQAREASEIASSTKTDLGIFKGVEEFSLGIDGNFKFQPHEKPDYRIVHEAGTAKYTVLDNEAIESKKNDSNFVYLHTPVAEPFRMSVKMVLPVTRSEKDLLDDVLKGGIQVRDASGTSTLFESIVFLNKDASLHKNNRVITSVVTLSNGYRGPIFPIVDQPSYEIYFRLTCYAVNQPLIYEWSRDGINWIRATPVKKVNLSFRSPTDIGLYTNLNKINGEPVHVVFENVSIQPIKTIYGERLITPEIDNSFAFQIKLHNVFPEEKEIEYREHIMGDSAILDISHGGVQSRTENDNENMQSISWSLRIPPGETTLQYKLATKIGLDTQDEEQLKWPYIMYYSDLNNIPVSSQYTGIYPRVSNESSTIPHWRFWTVEDGLISSDLKYITSSSDGGIYLHKGAIHHSVDWIQKYDGFDFHTIPLDKNMSGFVREGLDGSMWFFDDTANHLYRRSPASEPKDNLWEKCLDRNGNPLVIRTGTRELIGWQPYTGIPEYKNLFLPINNQQVLILEADCIKEYDFSTQSEREFLRSSSTDLGYFIHMIPSSSGGVWVSGERGAIKISIEEGNDCSITKDVIVSENFPFEQFHFPIEGSQDRLLMYALGKDNGQYGIFVFQDKYKLVEFDPRTRPIAISQEGGLWALRMLNEGESSIYFSYEYFDTNIPQQENIDGYYINDIQSDSDGSFWLASVSGMAHHTPALWRKPIATQMIDKFVSSIAEDQKGTVWFLCDDNLIKFNQKEWKVYKIASFSVLAKNTQALQVLPDDRLLLHLNEQSQNRKPLIIFDPETEKFDYLPGSENLQFNYLASGANKQLWAGVRTQDHFSLAQMIASQFQPCIQLGDAMSLLKINHLYQTGNGDLWLCTDSEESLQWFRNGEKQIWPTDREFPGQQPQSVLEIEEGKIWVGGSTSIYEFDGDKWTVVRSGFDQVPAMIEAKDGSIWVASHNGIFRYRDGYWTNIAYDDGLRTNIINTVFEDSHGGIWAGTMSGIYRYHSEADQDPPRTIIREEENLKDFASKGEVRITFSGIDKWKYTEQERLMYSYRLNQGEWSPFDTPNVATFTNMPPADYTIEVRAMDRNWNIDPSPSSFSFRVNHVPIQERAWFIPLVAGTVSLILLLAILAVVSRFQLAEFARNLESMVETRTRELHQTQRNILSISEREQQRIGQDLHDDVVQDLVGIAINSEVLLEELLAESPKRAEELQKILTKMDDATVKTQRLARGLSPVSIDKLGLVGSLQNICTHVRDYYGVDCHYQGEQRIPDLDSAQRLNLYRIAQEATNNAIKHAAAGHIAIQLSHTSDHLTLEIQDNGKGFSGGGSVLGMGLHIMNYRANTIGAEFDIQSAPGQGTRVLCILPLSENHREEGPS